MESEVKGIKYETNDMKKEMQKMNERLDVMQNVNLVHILQKQDQILKELNTSNRMNELEHEVFREKIKKIEKALNIA